MRDHVRFFLNGHERLIRGDAAFATLAESLRYDRGLVGTKVVCAEGDCGACTVLVGRLAGNRLHYVPIDACIQFVFQVDGAHVITVEGLCNNGDMHPAQQALVDCHGSQCGYCTPGIVMALAGWTESGARLNDSRIALTGNLCRCTGYLPILDAAETLAQRLPTSIAQQYSSPEMLDALRALSVAPIRVITGSREFFAPTTIAEAVAFKVAHPQAVVVAGATELGVDRNKRGFDPLTLLSLSRIRELDRLEVGPDRLTFGANVTWAQVEGVIRERLPQFLRIVERFGSPQIRHAATLVGNVANGSPIADVLPLLSVMDAEVELTGSNGSRRRSINGFYTAYKKKDLRIDELITRIVLPLPGSGERLRLYKVSRRTDLDISTFAAAIRILERDGTIESARIAYGGVAPTVVRLPKTEEFLIGTPFDERTFRQAGPQARAEATPISDVRGSADFRLQLCENVLRKFYFDESKAEVPT
jgi:xanthine dehydrogenase small subunit